MTKEKQQELAELFEEVSMIIEPVQPAGAAVSYWLLLLYLQNNNPKRP